MEKKEMKQIVMCQKWYKAYWLHNHKHQPNYGKEFAFL